ncbi:hypothetical protein FH972_005864 [Carpinus fangiana]|uniref:Uncharacterized protein n=1 Tax=Carpinus fangiana TaxID=176857 RepID=A0A5N6QQJ7_9ROSI|nr:hypothetical protein FH972_005864 [Carpinus fangiana]
MLKWMFKYCVYSSLRACDYRKLIPSSVCIAMPWPLLTFTFLHFFAALVALLLLLPLSSAVEYDGEGNDGQCKYKRPLDPRPHSVSILEFGAVGDGKTLNTVAFQNAIFYLKSFANKGGAQLYVPAGRWLTGSFNLTSHLTLFLERDATILGSEDYTHWDIVDPLPSYGRGIEFPGGRYRDNGTIDGQGSVWWNKFMFHSLNHSRPTLVEFVGSNDIIISNLTFLNAPAWNIHPVYCSNVLVQNIIVHAPSESPYTSGIIPDSSEYVCIENCNISIGYNAIVLKSGWDEYGIGYGQPTTNIHIKGVNLRSSSGSGLAFGSEMSGGISNILVEQLHLQNSFIGVRLKTNRGRGGYMKNILVSDVELKNIHMAIKATGHYGSHPNDKYDSSALPVVSDITFRNMVGENITIAGNLSGIHKSPFTSICLSNITFSIHSKSSPSWFCSSVLGISEFVSPEPCAELQDSYSNSSSACFLLLHSYTYSAVL